ncbi:MAG: NUDIX domain-containing protein [Candidatus Paceibacterota bacterium]|jgi:8-oxo-dGTP pyrophosphatase MutT (NUDIX family)
MTFNEEDQIEYSADTINHESAGGFVFFESPKDHQLFVALLRKAEGGYVIPKGHIHKGEAPNKAAIREVKEELNLNSDPEIISKIGTASYTFKLEDSDAIHNKNVQLFVFQMLNKADIYPQKNEGYEFAEWVPFEQALDQMVFDKENLLKAREHFKVRKDN